MYIIYKLIYIYFLSNRNLQLGQSIFKSLKTTVLSERWWWLWVGFQHVSLGNCNNHFLLLLFLSLSLWSSVSSCHKNEHAQASTHAHLHIISGCSDTTLRISTAEDHFTVPPPFVLFFWTLYTSISTPVCANSKLIILAHIFYLLFRPRILTCKWAQFPSVMCCYPSIFDIELSWGSE